MLLPIGKEEGAEATRLDHGREGKAWNDALVAF